MGSVIGILFTVAILLAAINGFRNAVIDRKRIKAAALLVVIILLVPTIAAGGYIGFGFGFGVSSQSGGG
jgi:hypothetical protein